MRYQFDLPDNFKPEKEFIVLVTQDYASRIVKPIPSEPEKSNPEIIVEFSIEDFKLLKESLTKIPKLEQQNAELQTRITQLEGHVQKLRIESVFCLDEPEETLESISKAKSEHIMKSVIDVSEKVEKDLLGNRITQLEKYNSLGAENWRELVLDSVTNQP